MVILSKGGNVSAQGNKSGRHVVEAQSGDNGDRKGDTSLENSRTREPKDTPSDQSTNGANSTPTTISQPDPITEGTRTGPEVDRNNQDPECETCCFVHLESYPVNSHLTIHLTIPNKCKERTY